MMGQLIGLEEEYENIKKIHAFTRFTTVHKFSFGRNLKADRHMIDVHCLC